MIRQTLVHRRPKSALQSSKPPKKLPALIDSISDEGSGVAQINFNSPVLINERVVPEMTVTLSAGSALAQSITGLDDQTAEVQFATTSPLVSVRVVDGEPSVHTISGGPIPPGTYPIT